MAKEILMCPPEYFEVEYEINPWMRRTNRVHKATAAAQWHALHDIYTRHIGWTVHVMAPVAQRPDLVFTANGGLVIGGEVVLPQFRHPERQPERADFEAWFRDHGFTRTVALRHDFEGEGDALLWNGILWAGYPWRSDKLSHDALAQHFDIEVVSLQLTDARFYHLDTALTVVNEDTVALFAPAFTAESVERVRSRVPNVISATSADAEAYGLNGISDGEHIVLSDRAHDLIQAYRDLGMTVWPTPIGEFQKSGGGVKCLSLELRR